LVKLTLNSISRDFVNFASSSAFLRAICDFVYMCVKKGETNGKHERHGDRDEYKSSTAAHSHAKTERQTERKKERVRDRERERENQRERQRVTVRS